MVKDYELNDIVLMKKAHPCETRSKQFEIVRLGADIKIKCLGCGRYIMLPRADFEEKCQKNLTKEK